jgi:hypothetical protein
MSEQWLFQRSRGHERATHQSRAIQQRSRPAAQRRLRACRSAHGRPPPAARWASEHRTRGRQSERTRQSSRALLEGVPQPKVADLRVVRLREEDVPRVLASAAQHAAQRSVVWGVSASGCVA